MNRQHPRVLIVEDDKTVLHMLAKIFSSVWYWEVARAMTVADGLRRLDEMPLDLIVLDLMLPDGDGIAVLQAVRDRRLAIPVAVSTAKDFQDLSAVIALKPEQLLFKPFMFEPLATMAAEIYDKFVPRAPAPPPANYIPVL